MRNRQTNPCSQEGTPPPPVAANIEVPGHIAFEWAQIWNMGPDEVRNPIERNVLRALVNAVRHSARTDPDSLLRAINSPARSVRDAGVSFLHESLAHTENAAEALEWFFTSSKADGRAFIARGLLCDHPTMTRAEISRFMNRALRDHSAWVRECAILRLEGERYSGCLPMMRHLLQLAKDAAESELLAEAIEIIEKGYVVRETEEPDDGRLEIQYVRTRRGRYDSHVIFWTSRRRVEKYGARCLIDLAEERHRREIKRRDLDM